MSTYTQEQVDVMNARIDGVRDALKVLERHKVEVTTKAQTFPQGSFGRRRYAAYANLILKQIKEVEQLL